MIETDTMDSDLEQALAATDAALDHIKKSQYWEDLLETSQNEIIGIRCNEYVLCMSTPKLLKANFESDKIIWGEEFFNNDLVDRVFFIVSKNHYVFVSACYVEHEGSNIN